MRRDNQGMVLIASYLVLSIFLAYSMSIILSTMGQRLSSDLLRSSFHAQDIAQSAAEQVREDLYAFFAQQVYAQTNDAVGSMAWLDTLGQNIAGMATGAESPLFDLLPTPENGNGVRDGVKVGIGLPRVVSIPIGTGQAWIEKICVDPSDEGSIPDDCIPNEAPLAPRLVTVQGTAQVGSAIKTVRATYEFTLGVSDIFKYAYFVNNYGWFDVEAGKYIQINGDIRANGDLDLTGDMTNVFVHGELSASVNPYLDNPITGDPSSGAITGDPNSETLSRYWRNTSSRARPTREVTPFSNGQPPIGGTPKVLPKGQGWDHTPANQPRNTGLSVQDMPYLGNLSFYDTLASQLGSSLTYNEDTNNDGYYGGAGDARPTIPGSGGATGPLILVGTKSRPIVINGPVVVPGDVIIRGWVKGQGTIYAGRNVHIIGEINYVAPPILKAPLERDTSPGSATAGRLRQRNATSDNGGTPWNETNLGTVCSSSDYYGQYFGPGDSVPAGCL